MAGEAVDRPKLAIYASPECCRDPNLRLYKSYYNVAWFVRAYTELLFEQYDIVTTDETAKAILDVQGKVDEDLANLWDEDKLVHDTWRVPLSDKGNAFLKKNLHSLGSGFDAQVRLAAMVAKRAVDRLLMFQDPDDVNVHLPEAHALIRNCTLAGIALNINAGATFWAESQWRQQSPRIRRSTDFGKWRNDNEVSNEFYARLNPEDQTIAFIAHDAEKPKMSRLIHHYGKQFGSHRFELTGTAGTCKHARDYFYDSKLHWDASTLHPVGAADGAGHGPTGGDVVIAEEIVIEWGCDNNKREALLRKYKEEGEKKSYKAKPPVRMRPLSHTVIFFIDHKHAQPHQADIHLLLRTCLHPSHGVHILLNERTAREWAETLTPPAGKEQ